MTPFVSAGVYPGGRHSTHAVWLPLKVISLPPVEHRLALAAAGTQAAQGPSVVWYPSATTRTRAFGDTGVTPLLDFYTNAGTDRAGRTFDDVMNMTDDALDASNDWVQWTFPLGGPCNLNPAAPAPTSPEIAFLKANPEAQTNLGRAFERFLRYLGLREEPAGQIAPGPTFAERHGAVWSHFNDNQHQRIAE